MPGRSGVSAGPVKSALLLSQPFYRYKSEGQEQLQSSPVFIQCFQKPDSCFSVNCVLRRVNGTNIGVARNATMNTC